MLDLESAIKHCEEVANGLTAQGECEECAKEHKQLARWLKELKQLKEQEPCEDCISRQAALDTFGLSEKSRKYGGDHSGYDTIMLYEVQDALEALPSVTPQQKTGQVHIDDIYRLISGHSNYHGDNILAALTCLAEGKEVPNPINVLEQQEIDKYKAEQSNLKNPIGSTTKNDLVVREFEGIEVTYPSDEICTYPKYRGKPYFGIKYKENGKERVGYGTYNPQVLSQYLKDYFISTTKNDLTKDCISRKELLKIYEDRFLELQRLKHLKDNKGTEDKQMGINYCINILKELPSVTPQPKIKREESCEMTVEEYRERMIQAFHNADTDELLAICVQPMEKEFEHLEWLLKNHYKKESCENEPSVNLQSKIGYWIRIDKDKLKCSECNIVHFIAQYPMGKIDYCPNCGTKMQKRISEKTDI